MEHSEYARMRRNQAQRTITDENENESWKTKTTKQKDNQIEKPNIKIVTIVGIL